MSKQAFPYTTLPGRLRDFLKSVPKIGKPDKATGVWFSSLGYSGGNARTIPPVLRFVGVIDKASAPTPVWDALRRNDKKGRAEFAQAVRQAYAPLFQTHPDAVRKDAEALRNFFRAHTTGADRVQSLMVQTFKTLAEFGDFDADPVDVPVKAEPEPRDATAEPGPVSTALKPAGAASGIALSVNLELHLPATTDADVYEKLFGAMRKHLIDLSGE